MIEPGGHRSLWTFHAAMNRGGNLDELIDVVEPHHAPAPLLLLDVALEYFHGA